jgi:hypothetical protein
MRSGVEPWAGGDKELFVRVIPTRITGRRIRRAGAICRVACAAHPPRQAYGRVDGSPGRLAPSSLYGMPSGGMSLDRKRTHPEGKPLWDRRVT